MRVLAAVLPLVLSHTVVSVLNCRAINRIAITPHVLTLTASTHKHPLTPSSSYLHKRRNANTTPFPNTTNQHPAHDDPGTTQQDLLTLGGRVYMTKLTLNNLTYNLVIDTGSSDTWLASSSFQCVSRMTRTVLPQAACGFAALYDPALSPSYSKEVKGGFGVKYTDGEFLAGDLGEEDVFVGDLGVRQMVGVVKEGWWIGDARSSGLMGLAYSGLASGVGRGGEGGGLLNYTSIMFTLFDTHPIPPVFSLALSRPTRANPAAGGLLAIGGIPDIPHDDNWASTPIIPRVRGKFLFYSILVDGFIITPQAASTEPLTGRIRRSPRHVLRQLPSDGATFGTLRDGEVLGEKGNAEPSLLPVSDPETVDPTSLPGHAHGRIPDPEPQLQPQPQPQPISEPQLQPVSGASPDSKIQMTIDSGATNMCTSPQKPQTTSPRSNTYTVPCTSIPPRFAVVIEGVPFYVDPQDLMLGLPGSGKGDRMGAGMGEELNVGGSEGRMCALSVQRSGTGDSVLGDAWLKGVVAVFDVGDNEMKFAAREKY